MKAVYQYKLLDWQVKDVDKKSRIVSGYFSAFNIKDADGDIIRPGAFQKSITENGPASTRPRIKHLLNHSSYQPLGKLTELKEDGYGLLYKSEIGTHALGDDFLKMVDSGLITEHSIGYRTIKWERDSNDDSVTNLTELKLWEGSSLTAWGANEFTPLLSGKGVGIDELEAKMKALDKFVKNSDATDETIELLMIHIKQLQQAIIDLKNSTEPVITTPPQKRVNDGLAKSIQELHALFA